VELAERRGWAEFARARKVAGERAYALTGDMVMLERALHSCALDLLTAKGFTAVSVPSLVKEAPLVGSGMFPKGREETYEIPVDNLFLAGTAEVALVGLHSGEILDKNRLPIRYAGISPCFRREIGSAGRERAQRLWSRCLPVEQLLVQLGDNLRRFGRQLLVTGTEKRLLVLTREEL
jgi:seryl-tRNA synthetase